MNDSAGLAVRAAADIAFSVLLGATWCCSPSGSPTCSA